MGVCLLCACAGHAQDLVTNLDGLQADLSSGIDDIIVSNVIVITADAADQDIDGNGNTVTTIDGGGQTRVLEVGPGVTSLIHDLTITGGSSTNGGALYIHRGASVTLSNCILAGCSAFSAVATNFTTSFTNVLATNITTYPTNFIQSNVFVYLSYPSDFLTTNIATFDDSSALPDGYIYTNTFTYVDQFGITTNQITLFTNIAAGTNFSYVTNFMLVTNATVSNNGANGSDNPRWSGGNGRNGLTSSPALGGAIYNLGSLTLLNCTLTTNSATGGNGGSGGNGGNGGGELSHGGNGGHGGAGSPAYGGAIYNLGTLVVSNCTLSGNTAVGGNGGTGGTGGTGFTAGLPGAGGAGGAASGAGIYSSNLVKVINCTLSGNTATAGTGATGGVNPNGNGLKGLPGGSSLGGGLCNLGTGALTNCTLFEDTVTGGTGGSGGSGTLNAGAGGDGGSAYGGGVYNAGKSVVVVNCTFSSCGAFGGTNGVAGSGQFPTSNGHRGAGHGGNIANAKGTFTLLNSIIDTNLSGGGGYGVIKDAGYNISDDNTIALGKTSKRKTNPLLGPLEDNGGPTQTMAPLSNSPALGPLFPRGGPPTDQRGASRPPNKSDIGAYQWAAPFDLSLEPVMSSTNGGLVTLIIDASGDSALSYQWQENGVSIPGATNAIYTFAASNAGPYEVVVSDSYGSSTLTNVMLNFAPSITVQPANQAVPLGSLATFTVTAAGDPTLTYQWLFNGSPITNVHSSSYTVSGNLTNAGTYTVKITNPFGSITSVAATLTILPAIVVEPVSQIAAIGSNVTFSVSAAGSPPLTYQWLLNGVPIPGANSSNLVVNAQATNGGGYTVVVSNAGGSVTSSPPALLSEPPLITSEIVNTIPVSATLEFPVLAGSTNTFNVAAEGTPPPSYQWTFNGTNVPGATNSTFVLANTQPADTGTYLVVVSNQFGSATGPSVGLGVLPTILVPPVSLSVPAGSNATFCVTAIGTAPLSYQWQFNGTNVSGATGTSFTRASVAAINEGTYTVMVTNTFGGTNASATLGVLGPPFIIAQPTNQTVFLGSNATFSVTAGGGTLSYQWQFNGTNLAGATSNAFAIPSVQRSNLGGYSVMVTNAYGFVMSTQAMLAVGAAPSVTLQPSNQTASVGAPVTFSVVASGNAPLAYQWHFNGVSLPGATGAACVLTNLQTNMTGSYAVTVTNLFGTITSSPAVLNVVQSPAILVPPASQSVLLDGTVTFEVTAAGVAPLSYLWSHGGSSTGAVGPSFTIYGAQAADAGDYEVLVSNPFGSVRSYPATLTVVGTAPSITASLASNILSLEFSPAETNFTYVLEYKTNSSDSYWIPIGTNVPITNGPSTFQNSVTNDLQRFYRILVR